MQDAGLIGQDREQAGPVYFVDLVSSKANFARLREFAKAWHKRRRLLELPDDDEVLRRHVTPKKGQM